MSAHPLCNPLTKKYPEGLWPAIEKQSLSRYFSLLDEFPNPTNAANSFMQQR
ncbi:MAG: hypothetical protein ACMV1C_06780 [Bacteroides graminisolvens]|uniref:Uncharacterized protein n=1 Tax=Bacteroides graminisolvens DSM 19988 = JCM 15093 TaxID=1121097 RepID=A0A069D371_9BACE|nr:hypothetical protein [Bacteroides sp.]MCD8495519.1 hypothetical protein [Bacteroides graminisolvens]MCD8571974.1 hypothetical protein [Bacteroides graminisolvens]MDD4418995.1 hypothetical protein [Bacteroides graminisolvens]GAK36877.1 hypothetical protein JCM15093_2079 [Bacteroides graminisolvens DSM 19988 = JCM 15093]